MSRQNKPPRLEQGAAATKDRLQKNKKGGERQMGKLVQNFLMLKQLYLPSQNSPTSGKRHRVAKGKF